jgi:hypothetical protein
LDFEDQGLYEDQDGYEDPNCGPMAHAAASKRIRGGSSLRAIRFASDPISIVLPENWTGGLDGESEETIIPSREIYETTT